MGKHLRSWLPAARASEVKPARDARGDVDEGLRALEVEAFRQGPKCLGLTPASKESNVRLPQASKPCKLPAFPRSAILHWDRWSQDILQADDSTRNAILGLKGLKLTNVFTNIANACECSRIVGSWASTACTPYYVLKNARLKP